MKTSTQQAIDWNGDSGAGWVAHQESLDRMLAPYGAAALRRAAVQPGQHVLDIGCGSGESTLALAAQVGDEGQALGVDISEPLVNRARERAQKAGSRAEFRIADASATLLPVGGFDCLFSRFGVMFFDDPVAAFKHLRACLRPGGRLVFACWRGVAENDWVKLPMTAIRDIAPPAPPAPAEAPGPFSFGDPDRVRGILTGAGFEEVEIAPFDHDILFGRGATGEEAVEAALERAFAVGPLRRALADQPANIREAAADAVRAAFAGRVVGADVVIDGAAWIVSALTRR